MSDHGFAFSVQQAGERLARLLDDAMAAGPDEWTRDVVQRLLHELSSGIEELRVAEEELIVQGEQLAATHDVVDAERERYGRLFEFAPDGYLETDAVGKILEANSAASRLLGVPVRFLVNKLASGFVDEPDRKRFRRLLTAVGRGDVPEEEVRLRIRPRASAPLTVGVTLATEIDPRDGELRIRWSLRDLTQRLKEQEELRALQGDVDLLVALGDVTRLTEGADPLEHILDGLMHLACDLLQDGTVSVTVLGRGHERFTTAAASDEVASALSEVQHRSGGPCIEAARDGVSAEVHLDEVAERWPELAAAAADEAVVEVVGLPLSVDDKRYGALNVYVRTPTTASVRRSLRLLAAQAGAAVANAELYRSAATLSRQLGEALETRVVIEQAKGALMAIQRCDADEAFDILRRASQRSNRKLRDVAAEFLDRALRSTPPAPPERA